MTFFHMALIAATFLCSIVAGFLFAFAVVVMPGIRSLDDGEFVWVGSVLSLVAWLEG